MAAWNTKHDSGTRPPNSKLLIEDTVISYPKDESC